MTETPDSTRHDSTVTANGSPPIAPGAVPTCFVVDDEPSIRHFLSLVLHGAGIDTLDFADGASMRAALAQRVPDLVFLNISLDSADAIETVLALGHGGFCGSVQLMSTRGAAVLDHVRKIGIQQKLNMLAALKKPFETEVIIRVLRDLNLGTPSAAASRIDLADAIESGWVEFWYQPKIDLRKKRLAGAEAFARVRHPSHGVALPGSFMPGADDNSVLKLSEMALLSALRTAQTFSKLGLNLPFTVNIPVPALEKLKIEDIIRANRPETPNWAGLIVDVPEEQIIADLFLAGALAKRLQRCHTRLAIDDFGRGMSSLARLGEMPFAELKLDRSFVIDCGTDRVNAPLCKTVIDLAHNYGQVAVAMGIEKAADMMALVSMGCDYGQGFLLGQPMPEDRFISLLRQRTGAAGREAAAAS
ncbi:MAG: EAL domain-containing response regulator [Pseudolabrys sp.]|jgi:EAL domain-containing protein (putative c-di-GMP-specific phosphodiesterase class I)